MSTYVGVETAKMVTDLNILQKHEVKWSKYYHDSRGPSVKQAQVSVTKSSIKS